MAMIKCHQNPDTVAFEFKCPNHAVGFILANHAIARDTGMVHSPEAYRTVEIRRMFEDRQTTGWEIILITEYDLFRVEMNADMTSQQVYWGEIPPPGVLRLVE